tara:strand:+ start:3510 stop:3917 length:408 start_codon:yes stop_codon:yes gene_type:complete
MLQNKGLVIKNLILLIITIFIFTACVSKKPTLSSSATILIKTPKMKFYDKGFIYNYNDYTQVQIFSAGTVVLDMKIYNDRVCKSTFECQDLKTFNRENLNKSYNEMFLKNLFNKNEKEVVHRDKENNILIKIKRD